jgi:hypothetical protein
MTRKYAGALPGKIGKAARRGGVVGPKKPRQFSSELVSVDPGPVADPEREMHLRSLVARFSGDVNRKAMKVKFLASLDPGSDRQLRLGEAWRACHPNSKANVESCYSLGSRLYAEILKDLGPDPHPADVLALCGIHTGSIGQDLARMRFAKVRREYYDFRTGKLTYGAEVDDNMAILRQVELSMKAVGLGRDKDPSAGPLVVQIVSYLGPNDVKNWPGGGRISTPIDAKTIPYTAPRALPAGTLGEGKDGP